MVLVFSIDPIALVGLPRRPTRRTDTHLRLTSVAPLLCGDPVRFVLSGRASQRTAAYIISVTAPVTTNAPAQSRSTLNQARRRNPTPIFSNTSSATKAVTAR
jgi:hypothetical protein